MRVPYNDRWERTKRYLHRHFLVNPGFRLSPIPEEKRSPSPSDTDSLPDLVVEPEPNRHDDPPEFYEGLARRMRRLHRQLFLGVNESDDDSPDFEVNRSMASTFKLIDTRKDNEANTDARESAGDLGDSAKNTKSTKYSLEDDNENQDKYDDLIDTCATYNDTKHVSTESSSVDEETPILIETDSINESHSNKTDDPVHIEAYGNQSYEDSHVEKLKKSALNETVDASIIETELDTEGSAPCHRISTTVAEIHERPARDAHEFDNGSPVLIPRLLQFGRRVFGSRVARESGQSFNSEASDEFIRKLSSHISDVSKKHDDDTEEPEIEQRLLTASDLTRASLDSDKLDTGKGFKLNSSESFDDLTPIAHSSAKSIEDDGVEVMREARADVNESWHGEAVQDSPELAFEAQTDADTLDNESSDSIEINASFEELEASVDQHSTTRHVKIIDEFWSVSTIDLDKELPKESRGSKRRAGSSSDGDAASTKRMKDIATQTDSETHTTWEDIRTEFFVGSPVVLRLCGCQDHVCS